jgi:hypothetical protein
MTERIKDDYCVEVRFGDDSEYLIDPKYDRLDRFTWLGANILRVVCEEGIAHVHIDDKDAEKIIDNTKLPVCYPEFMVRSDYEIYLNGQEKLLDDSWLE